MQIRLVIPHTRIYQADGASSVCWGSKIFLLLSSSEKWGRVGGGGRVESGSGRGGVGGGIGGRWEDGGLVGGC